MVSESRHTKDNLKGAALTHEQISDVYAAGTSDGLVQLEEGMVHSGSEGYDGENRTVDWVNHAAKDRRSDRTIDRTNNAEKERESR